MKIVSIIIGVLTVAEAAYRLYLRYKQSKDTSGVEENSKEKPSDNSPGL